MLAALRLITTALMTIVATAALVHADSEPSSDRSNEIRVIALPGILDDNLAESLSTFLRSCQSNTVKSSNLQQACEAGLSVPEGSNAEALIFFDTYFTAQSMRGANGLLEGLATGYMEPTLEFSYSKTGDLTTPLYAKPDMLPKDKPFFTREEIEKGGPDVAPYLDGKILGYAKRFPGFILSIQGSGRLSLLDGTSKRILFAARNGHPYKSAGRMLYAAGKIKGLNQSAIEEYINNHPDEADSIYWYNPAYIFFQLDDIPAGVTGPPGALNLPLGLTPFRSVAVDATAIPLGSPVFVKARIGESLPFAKLMIAQDKGNAITGTVRVDVFMGSSEEGEKLAKSLYDPTLMVWRLTPKQLSATSVSSASE